MRLSPKSFALAIATLWLVVSMGVAQAYDPPLRVARLSYVDGNVSFSPAGERQWLRARRNRPHVRGDRFWTADRSRAELQLGAAVVRMDERTSLEILNLDDRFAQFELTQGTLNLRVLRLYEGQTYEVATPTLAFVVSEPGEYRIDVDERGGWTEVVMWEGTAIAYGDRARFPLRAGDAIRFVEPTLRDYDVFRFPRPDSFDRFAELRNERLERSLALRYVPDDLIGYSDLDEYGSWSQVRDYGNVWFPTRVNAGWAPYRHGNWIWQDPWGWTWVDDSDWGFAPFHYGRWVQVDRRWGWIPSARRSRAVYAPALVAFLGTGRGYTGREPIGWFPLGPRDVYVPSYSASRDYFTRINSGYSTINVATINNVYSSYATGGRTAQRDYMYRNSRDAVTAVPADVFVNARPVRAAALPYDRTASALSEATHIARMAPTVQSFTGNTTASTAAPAREVLDRRVIARTAPPPAAVPFEARRQALGRTPGRPLDPAEMDTLRGQGRGRSADTAQQVRVVGAGTPVQRPANEARDATRQLERMGGAAPDDPAAGRRAGDFDRGRDAGEARGQAGRASEARAEPEAMPERDEGARPRGRDRDPGAEAQERDAAREAGRQAEQEARERERAEQAREQDERQEAQRQQREAERTQRELQQQREQTERAAGEERRAAQEAQQAQREQQRQQREAEAAQREQQAQQREAEQAQRALQQERQQAEAAQREQQREQREAEAAQREQQRLQREAQQRQQAEGAQQQAAREAEAAQREQERQQRDAERAQRQAEQAQQQAERAARQQQQEAQQAEAAQRNAERQAQQAQQAQQQAERAMREQQRAEQQAAQQAEAAQREAERAQRAAEQAQEPDAGEKDKEEEEGNGKGRFKRDRDGG